MSRRDIECVATLAAHLSSLRIAAHEIASPEWAPRCATDAMRLQALGRKARVNAAKRWIHPENRDTKEEIQPYLDGCLKIHRAVEAVLSPYGMQHKDIVISRDGVTILALPGDHNAMFGTGFLI